MPVLGHAFIGLATGLFTQPAQTDHSIASNYLASLWLPLILALAYFPDIIAQILSLCGLDDGRIISHSGLFAGIVSVLIAISLVYVAQVSFRRIFAISLFSILLHDLLDICQSSDRQLWWPFSKKIVGIDMNFIPTGLIFETGLFGIIFLGLISLRSVATRHFTNQYKVPAVLKKNCTKFTKLNSSIIIAMLLTAIVTHVLQDIRENQLRLAHAELLRHNYLGALSTLTQAARWPNPAKPGRIDYFRAEALSGLGDTRRAEKYYLISYQTNPDYFWCLADLALFYASSEKSVFERRRLVLPYLQKLRKNFTGHEKLSSYYKSIIQKIGDIGVTEPCHEC